MTSTPTGREDCEAALIDAVLHLPNHQGEVFSGMKPEYFTNPQFGSIFRASMELFDKGQVVSIYNLRELFSTRNHNQLPTWFIDATMSGNDNVTTIPAYIPQLKEAVIKAYVFAEFRDKAMKATTVAEAEKAAVDLLEVSTALQYDNEPDLVQAGEAFILKQEKIRSGDMTWGYSLGTKGMDKHVTLTPGGLYVIGGIKKGGKTQFALSLLDHNLRVDPPVPSMMFSIEMSLEQVLRKLAAKRSGINSRTILTRYIDDLEMDKIKDAVHDIVKTPLKINQSPAVSTVEVQSRTRNWLRANEVQRGSGIVVVDFIQLMATERNKYESEATTLKNIAYSLARMAKQTDTAVVALAQLRNEAEGQVPQIGYLEGSGGIAQAAEAIILLDLHKRRGAGGEKSCVGSGLDEFSVIIAGQRHGESGTTIPMLADLTTGNFYDRSD